MDELFTGRIVYWVSGKRWVHDFKEGGLGIANRLTVSFFSEATEKSLKIHVDLNAEVEIELEELYLTMQQAVAADDQIFLNGYQSWTESKLFSPDDKIPRLAGPAQIGKILVDEEFAMRVIKGLLAAHVFLHLLDP